ICGKPEVIEATRRFLRSGRFTDGSGAKSALRLVQPAYRGWLFPEDQVVRWGLPPPLPAESKFTADVTAGGRTRSVHGEAKTFVEVDLGDLAPGDYDLDVDVRSE